MPRPVVGSSKRLATAQHTVQTYYTYLNYPHPPQKLHLHTTPNIQPPRLAYPHTNTHTLNHSSLVRNTWARNTRAKMKLPADAAAATATFSSVCVGFSESLLLAPRVSHRLLFIPHPSPNTFALWRLFRGGNGRDFLNHTLVCCILIAYCRENVFCLSVSTSLLLSFALHSSLFVKLFPCFLCSPCSWGEGSRIAVTIVSLFLSLRQKFHFTALCSGAVFRSWFSFEFLKASIGHHQQVKC